MKNIEIKDLIKLENANLIDIREISEYKEMKVKGFTNIVKSNLEKSPEKYLNKEETYYLMCKGGVRSRQTTMILGKLGYNVVNVLGGILEFNKNHKEYIKKAN